MPLPHVAILGAGPIGLEAAVLLAQHGFPVRVYERGGVGEHLGEWGHVRLFSPWGLNVSPWGRARLAGGDLPPDDALLTGDEFRQRYLEPLARCPLLDRALCEQTTVRAIGRHRVGKQDEIGRATRRDGGFRLLVQDECGERSEFADIVLDCTGTYGQHRWLGAGGVPCPGETSLLAEENYQLPDVQGQDRARFSGRTTLIVGAGYSAATAVAEIARLAKSTPNTRVIWLTRRAGSAPMEPIANDALSGRAALTATANRLATTPGSCLTWKPGWVVQAVAREEHWPQTASGTRTSRYSVGISPTGETTAREFVAVDELLGLVGYRPDHALYDELQVHQCYASQAPMKLAAKLLGESSSDCLTQTGQGIDVLRNPEPGFFILGAKSYGRDPRFLLKIGIEQVRTVVEELCRDAGVHFTP
jgi:hypothetical protein